MSKLDEMIKELCPEGVEWKKIGDIAYISDYVSAGSFASIRENVNYLQNPDYAVLLRFADYSNGFDKSKFVYVSKHSYNFLKKSNLNPGDIIISNVGSCGQMFRCPDLGMKATLAPNSIVFRAENNSFFFYWLTTDKGQKDIERITSKSAMPKFNKTQFKEILVPYPPLSIQQKIVSVLDSFTILIDKMTQEVEKRKKQMEYYREKLLTFKDDECEWKTLGICCQIFDGIHQTPKYKDSGVKFVSVEDIDDLYASTKYISQEDYESQYKNKPQKSDILMTRIGSVGKCSIVSEDTPIAFYVSLALLRTNKTVLPKYIRFYLESCNGATELRKHTLVHAVPLKINLGDIGKVRVPIPPLFKQSSIVSTLDKFESYITKLEKMIVLRQKQYEYYREQLLTFE